MRFGPLNNCPPWVSVQYTPLHSFWHASVVVVEKSVRHVNRFTVVEIRFTSEAFVINQNFSHCVNERMIFLSCIWKQLYFCGSIIEHYVVPFLTKQGRCVYLRTCVPQDDTVSRYEHAASKDRMVVWGFFGK